VQGVTNEFIKSDSPWCLRRRISHTWTSTGCVRTAP